MTTSSTIPLACRCCGEDFETETFLTTNTFGPVTTDLYRMAAGASPLPLQIHTCPACGFSGGLRDFLTEEELPRELKERIRREITPLVKDRQVSPWNSYQYTAWLAEWQGAPSYVVGQLYHKAAWCCFDALARQEEKQYRRQVIRCYERSLAQHEVPDDQVAVYTYLIGEMHRRVGAHEEAGSWFDRVEQAVGTDRQGRWLVDLAAQQKTDPKEFLETDDAETDA